MKQRNTNETLQHKLSQTTVPDATEGWDAMRPLLNANPIKSKPKTIFIVIKRIAIAAACLVLIGFMLWQLIFKTQPITTLIHSEHKLTQTNSIPQEKLQSNAHKPIHSSQKEIKKSNEGQKLAKKSNRPTILTKNKTRFYSLEERLSRQTLLPTLIYPKKIRLPNTNDLPAPSLAQQHSPIRNQIKKIYTKQLLSLPKQTQIIAAHAEENKDQTLHISLRLKANSGASFGQQQQNFNPVLKGTPVDIYPAIYVSKMISDKVGVQAGLAVVSPVDISNAHLNRSVPNDNRSMAAMAVESRDNFQISRLYYVDVPVTVQYHLSDRFTVGSGLQLSILEKVIGSKQRVDYDANYAVMYATPSEPVPMNLTGNEQAEYGINPLDLRWLGTLKYHISEKWLASFQFQYGLLDVSDNQAFLRNHRDHNIVVSAGIGFLIK